MIIGSLEYEKLKSAAQEAAAYREALEQALEAMDHLGIKGRGAHAWRDLLSKYGVKT